MTLEKQRWTLQRDADDFTALLFGQRFIGHFSDDGRMIDCQWERSDDGVTWEHDFALTYKKIT